MTELLDLHREMLLAEIVPADAAGMIELPRVQFARLRKLMERSIAVSARRNIPGQATYPVLFLVEVLRWQREYDGSWAMWWEWSSAHDRIVRDWLEWHARYYGYDAPTIEDTVARLTTLDWTQRQRGGRDD